MYISNYKMTSKCIIIGGEPPVSCSDTVLHTVPTVQPLKVNIGNKLTFLLSKEVTHCYVYR